MTNAIRKVKVLHEVQRDSISLGIAEVWEWLSFLLPDLGNWFRRITGLIAIVVLTADEVQEEFYLNFVLTFSH